MVHRFLCILTLLSLAAIGRAQTDTPWSPEMPAGLAATAVASPEKTTVRVVTDLATVAPGGKFKLALILEHAPHKHTYWNNPGDTGVTTDLIWTDDDGVKFTPLRHPAPVLYRQQDILSFVHEGRVVLVTEGTVPAGAQPGRKLSLKGELNWLECDENSCMPGDAPVAFTLTVGDRAEPGPDAALVAEAEAKLPAQPPLPVTLADVGGTPTLTLAASALAGRDVSGATLFPLGYATGESDAALTAFALAKAEKLPDGALRFTHPKAGAKLKTAPLAAVIRFDSGRALAVSTAVAQGTTTVSPATPATPAAGDERPGFLLALALAFGGGILLNIMPCVFPVLGLKIYGFVNKAGGDTRAALRHGLAFAGGIVVSFWALAGALIAVRGVAAGWLGATEGELGWGFLQQMPGFNALIAALFLIMALGMCGVFEFGTGVQSAAGSVRERDGLFGSFLSGALATIVATPCSGPGMAPAISYALGAPAAASFAVFTALALGLAAPFVVFSASPKLLALLPRPGVWMESFKQGMSFLLFGSFAYFIWVLSGQLDEQSLLLTLFAYTALAFAVWVYGRWTAPERTERVRRVAMLIAALIALGSGALIHARLPGRPAEPAQAGAPAATIVWTPWSESAQAAALASGKPVYIDFTARWCLSCQANKYVYRDDAVIRAFAERRVVALKADWSNRDRAIAAELAKYGKVSIPFNVVLRPDAAPKSLPAVLTPGAVVEAVATP